MTAAPARTFSWALVATGRARLPQRADSDAVRRAAREKAEVLCKSEYEIELVQLISALDDPDARAAYGRILGIIPSQSGEVVDSV